METVQGQLIWFPNELSQQSDILFKDWYLSRFLPLIQQRVKRSTFSNYLRLSHSHILPFFAQMKLAKIDDQTMQEFIHILQEKELSISSIRLIFSIVKQAMNEAVFQGIITRKLERKIYFPKEKPKKVHSLSLAQQLTLEKLARNHKHGLPILLSLYAGLRIGEISGLTWEDIDFERNLLRVNKTIVRIKSTYPDQKKTQVISDTPKTSLSNRVVPLTKSLKELLLLERARSSSRYLVFTNNGLAEPRVISYRFKKLISETDFKDAHFHMLRHTFATRAIEQGIDIVSLSRILGHQSVKLTLDIYSDSMMEQRQKEIMKLENIFSM
ncbi:tyrosine-type recombinase/integrase [Enterococcus sp. LJL120]